MKFPRLPETTRLERLMPPAAAVRLALDTDAFNEIDDQFAVTYAALSPERMRVEAFYAAPFLNARSTSPEDGMEKSYDEILRLLSRLGRRPEGRTFRGSTRYLDTRDPEDSPAARDLVKRAMAAADAPLYVAAIGAITNVANALLIEPRLVERIVVVWLGGQPEHWADTREFNLGQDMTAARVVLDCGVPLIRIPCYGVASHLLMSLPELEQHLRGTGPIGEYLIEIFRDYREDHFAFAKELWDLSAVACLVNPTWTPSRLAPSPVLRDDCTWGFDPARHVIRTVTFVHRNPIFRDLFLKIAKHM